ncbi:hypothetical protein HA402_001277 [Bradysia odoriphaga]|nr:hypothetical protein HA402_001277 [Bradysia odoriphaga]
MDRQHHPDHHKFFEGEDHSNDYTKFRPKTPEQCIQWIVEYLSEQITKESGKFSAAADIGCGTGQCTVLLADYFKNVHGFDVAESQINQANRDNQYSNVSYSVSPAEQIPLPDHSLDLITCSQCFHWFDFENFYTEVNRLLKPGGVLALITYIRPLIVHSDNEIRNLIRNSFTSPPLNAFVDEKLKIVDNGYADVVLPFNDVQRRETTVYADGVTGSQIIGYIKSWSSYGRCVQEEPESAKRMLGDIESRIKSKTGKHVTDEQFTLETPFYVLMARK